MNLMSMSSILDAINSIDNDELLLEKYNILYYALVLYNETMCKHFKQTIEFSLDAVVSTQILKIDDILLHNVEESFDKPIVITYKSSDPLHKSLYELKTYTNIHYRLLSIN